MLVINLSRLMQALGVALALSQSVADVSNTPANAVLKGRVFDIGREAVVLDLTVLLENLQTGQVWRLATDESGSYSGNVPAGTYSITTEGHGAFLPFRRAPFQLRDGTTSIVNLVLSNSHSGIALTFNPRKKVMEDVVYPAPRQQYESFSIPEASPDDLKLLIQYQTKRASKDRTVYKWTKLSFDLVTVYADELTLDRKTLRFSAKGRVMVEDGKERRNESSVTLHFKDGKIIVESGEDRLIKDLDDGGGLSFEQDRPRIDLFAQELKRRSSTTGYIIAYGGLESFKKEAEIRLSCIRKYLTITHKIPRSRIELIDGGYRGQVSVVLFLVEPGDQIPTPYPLVNPESVRMKKAPKSKCD